MTFGQSAAQGISTQVIVTARGQKKQEPPIIQREDVQIKVDGKRVQITGWTPLLGKGKTVQLVFVMDDGLRNSIGRQLGDIRDFFMALPPSVQIGVGYMQNGRVLMPGGFTTDHAAAVQVLRTPIGEGGISASPYFCVSDLVKHWPGAETASGRAATKIILMITNGVDPYNGINPMNQQSPYVDAAVRDAQTAGIPVFSIYFADRGRMNSTGWANMSGQSYLAEISEGTGARSYYQGSWDPVSFTPYFNEFRQDLAHMYLATFPAKGKGLLQLKVSTELHHVKLSAPQVVNVGTMITENQ
ncbi:MAG: hypothetical protein ACYC46_03365 [Acidobacteriaceae bacterium]